MRPVLRLAKVGVVYFGGTGIGRRRRDPWARGCTSPASSRRCSSHVAPTPPACAGRSPCSGTPPGTARLRCTATSPGSRRPGRRPALPQREHRHQLDVARHLVGQHRDALRRRSPVRVEPELSRLEPVEQPVREARAPPASPTISLAQRRLCSGFSSSRMNGIRLDQVDPPLHQLPVRRGQSIGNVGDRRRAVPLEPARSVLARRDPARQHDLERSLARVPAQAGRRPRRSGRRRPGRRPR